jgi:hypothetical protein
MKNIYILRKLKFWSIFIKNIQTKKVKELKFLLKTV